jgi:TPR repeat protein
VQFTLGFCFHKDENGYGQDESKRNYWYCKSALQGNEEAVANIEMYLNNWSTSICKSNFRCQLSLSLKCLNGEGKPVDDAGSVKWCRKSAEQGNVQAQGFLNSEGKFQELLGRMNRH